jgi:hypothetical protein
MKAGQFTANNLFTGNASVYNPAEAPYNMANLVEFNALHYSPTQFGDARAKRPYQVYDEFGRNDAKQPTYFYVNVASRGRGGDTSWGNQAIPKGVYILNVAGKTVNYNFSIIPVDNFNTDSAMTLSKTRRDVYTNVKDLMSLAAAAGVPETDPAYVAAGALTASASELDATGVYNALYAVYDRAIKIEIAKGSATASIKVDTVPPVGTSIILSFYDAGEKLLGIKADSQTVVSEDFVTVKVSAAVPPGTVSVKAYYWGADLVPIVPAAQALVENSEEEVDSTAYIMVSRRMIGINGDGEYIDVVRGLLFSDGTAAASKMWDYDYNSFLDDLSNMAGMATIHPGYDGSLPFPEMVKFKITEDGVLKSPELISYADYGRIDGTAVGNLARDGVEFRDFRPGVFVYLVDVDYSDPSMPVDILEAVGLEPDVVLYMLDDSNNWKSYKPSKAQFLDNGPDARYILLRTDMNKGYDIIVRVDGNKF